MGRLEDYSFVRRDAQSFHSEPLHADLETWIVPGTPEITPMCIGDIAASSAFRSPAKDKIRLIRCSWRYRDKTCDTTEIRLSFCKVLKYSKAAKDLWRSFSCKATADNSTLRPQHWWNMDASRASWFSRELKTSKIFEPKNIDIFELFVASFDFDLWAPTCFEIYEDNVAVALRSWPPAVSQPSSSVNFAPRQLTSGACLEPSFHYQWTSF